MSKKVYIEKRQPWRPPNSDKYEPKMEGVDIIKIINRLKYLAVGHDEKGGEDVDPTINEKSNRHIIRIGPPLDKVDYNQLALQVVKIISNGTKSSEIDEYSIKCCLEMNLNSPQYGEMASRILISSIHKETPHNLFDAIKYAYFKVTDTGMHMPRIRDDILEFVFQYKIELERIIDYKRDYLLNYFGLMTLIKPGGIAYLNKDSAGRLVERPQHLFMREAIECHYKSADPINKIKETYDILSLKYATHATPTLANSCSKNPRLVSCNLLAMRQDSIEGIGESIRDIMILSKNEAGIGAYISNIRAAGAIIKSTGGKSKGLKPLLKIYEKVFDYIDQGGKRKGSAAFYIDVWHADFVEVIKMARNTHAAEEDRARHLFYGAVVNDLFMEKVKYECTGECPGEGKCPGLHYFMSPDVCPLLLETHNQEYVDVYNKYVSEKKYLHFAHARHVLYEVIFTMINAGRVYIFNRDAANRSNNLENVGIIQESNLCTEICLPVTKLLGDKTDIISVCNLASIKLDTFVPKNSDDIYIKILYKNYECDNYLYLNVYNFDGTEQVMPFNIKMFEKVVKIIVRNVDICIDHTDYPEEKTRKTNLAMRPIGVGVQALADLFMIYGLPYDSDKARVFNWVLFNWMYLFAMEATVELAAEKGTYQYFEGSPASKGILQFDTYKNSYTPTRADLMDLFVDMPAEYFNFSARYDAIRGKPMRNSLLVALMPTASTAHILNSYESFEPITSNLFTRGVLAGDFQVVNRHLLANLEKIGKFGQHVIDSLIINNGSVKALDIPEHTKQIYKTVYEVPMKRYIEMSADRAQFICHSQSLNLYWSGSADEIKNKIFSALMFGWEKGLKTLSYYTRIQTQTGQKFVEEKKEKVEMTDEEFRKYCAEQKEKMEKTGEISDCGGGFCGS